MSAVYEEVEIEDMQYDDTALTYTYPCPCGDKFEITLEELWDGEDLGNCPSCTLRIRIIYEEVKLPKLPNFEEDGSGDGEVEKKVEQTPSSSSRGDHFYPVGRPGVAWGDTENIAWFVLADVKKRSYADDVLCRLDMIKMQGVFETEKYGSLSQDPIRYPLFVVKTRDWATGPNQAKPCLLITGGVHGYETSGVMGALQFIDQHMEKYAEKFNIAVCPCVSPWGYECIQRWNAKTFDPNRFFVKDSPCEECAAVVALVASMNVSQWLAHWDLHETTDSDDFEFRPAKASRDGLVLKDEGIPDGFYLIGDRNQPNHEWHAAMINAVRDSDICIAPSDANNQIVGLDQVQPGVVNSDATGKGKGVANAFYNTSTEVYPNSKTAPLTGEQCSSAQVVAITAGIEHIITQTLSSK